jgi:hypothetical protein
VPVGQFEQAHAGTVLAQLLQLIPNLQCRLQLLGDTMMKIYNHGIGYIYKTKLSCIDISRDYSSTFQIILRHIVLFYFISVTKSTFHQLHSFRHSLVLMSMLCSNYVPSDYVPYFIRATFLISLSKLTDTRFYCDYERGRST